MAGKDLGPTEAQRPNTTAAQDQWVVAALRMTAAQLLQAAAARSQGQAITQWKGAALKKQVAATQRIVRAAASDPETAQGQMNVAIRDQFRDSGDSCSTRSEAAQSQAQGKAAA